MSKYTDTVKQDTPRLVVLFKRGDKGEEQFTYGVVGLIPITSLTGAIVAAQNEMSMMQFEGVAHWRIDWERFIADHECPESAFVLAFDPVSGVFCWFVHADIPVYQLLGMLETVKASLVGAQMAQMVNQQRTGLVAPDGKPIVKKPLVKG